ncbi:MAG: type 4a pilus biogenesis protein PilO [Chlamydiota bacterium]|nr:type 4a pilus biogenesis protein PilO [Chlamydiota bacterium]
MPRTFSYREKILALITALFVLIYLSDQLIASFIVPRFEELREKINYETVLLERYQQVIRLDKKIQEDHDRFMSQMHINGTIDEEISRFLQEVDAVCKNAGVRILDMKPASTKTTDQFQKIRIEIQLETQQANIGKLLLLLTRCESIINVDYLRITAGTDSNVLQCEIYLSRLIAF